MTKTIRLYGDLGQTFGSIFHLAVDSAAEAVRALCSQVDGFEKYLIDSEKSNVGFRVRVANSDLSIDEICLKSSGDIEIIPAIGGSNAEFRIIVGSALIAASAILSATGVGASVAPYLANAGVALILGGAIELLVGKPKAPDIDERPENKPSYLFNGAVNTTAQGHPVPVGYGRLRVGSAVISASISTKNLLSGYKRVTQEKYKIIMAYGKEDGLQDNPPEGWTRKELIDSGLAGPLYDFQYYWTWKYYYNETTLELNEV